MPHVLNYGALQFTQEKLTDLDHMQSQIDQDFDQSGISINDAVSHHLLVDFRSEGQCEKSADLFIRHLQSLGFRSVSVAFNAVVDVDSLPYRASCSPAYHSNTYSFIHEPDEINIEHIDAKFLCLMRRPSWTRARIAAALSTMPSVRYSFGSGELQSALTEYQQLLPEITLPVLIDGPIRGETTHLMYKVADAKFHHAVFNLVAESSEQSGVAWKSIFITEKTFKAFYLKQIPLWFAVPGMVAAVKSLGFDCFDDIIDHSYDTVQDEFQRHTAVIDQVKRLDDLYSLEQCRQLRRDFESRLQSNQKLIETLRIKDKEDYQTFLKGFPA